MKKNIKPGLNGLPPVKDQYDENEKQKIVEATEEHDLKSVAKAYGLTWQKIAGWKTRLINAVMMDKEPKTPKSQTTAQKTPQIIAADIDQESVDVTANKAVTNDVEKNITAILSDGYTNPIILKKAPYDIIFANILANPLQMMSKSAYDALKDKGCYLISGFIDNQEQEIIKHHQQLGFKLLKTYQMENWRAALLQK